MHGRAHLATELEVGPDASTRTRIAGLRSQAPLSLRPTVCGVGHPWSAPGDGAAHVCLAASAAGPLGGDRIEMRLDVGAGTTLALRDVSATLVLPGPHGEQSSLDADVRVGAGATLVWLAQPVIAARCCHHVGTVRVALEPGARLLLREELLLGRHGEAPGSIRQRLRVSLAGRPLLDQELALGPDSPASAGPAVTGGHRAIGSVLMVDPAWASAPPAAVALEGDAAIMPLAGPALLVSALCPDGLALRRTLDAGLALVERPGTPAAPPPLPDLAAAPA